ncbi:uncharacterized protein LOC132039562 isoform X2 [Lycium ferocissimum]|uniref:uncharacterized protein LOC132039562 isoform X2 n=1 Tax=Lycium ferocissimum TaxID=112874 RepID=UPI002814BF73|nr:uncharacterized protein LOC132039562 isoform X2 [Lycium ferocissimum]
MSGLFLGILCITKRGFQLRSFDSLTPSVSSKIEQRSIGSHGYNDENLGEKAREAKQRLDHRLRSYVVSLFSELILLHRGYSKQD